MSCCDRLQNARLALIALTGLIALPAAPAGAQDPSETPEGFSILASEPEAETQAEAPAIGPHLDRDAYLAARGDIEDTVLSTRWRIERTSLDGEPLDSDIRTVVIGDGYAFEPAADGRTVYDFRTDRILDRVDMLDGPVVRSRPIVAHVHRQMNTFAFYTRGGELDEVSGPGGAVFERFWIEAAMGVRLSAVELETFITEDDRHEFRRDPLGGTIFSYTPDEVGIGNPASLFRAWLRHGPPIHPDALDRLAPGDGIPARFSYIVFSPSSPDGRVESWTRQDATETTGLFPWPEDVPPAPASAYETASPELNTVLAAGMSALSGEAGLAPTRTSFVAASEGAQRRGDLPGSYLALQQAIHHYGPCMPQSEEERCTRLSRVVAAGLGNDEFEALMLALGAMQTDRAAAFRTLTDHLDRDAYAGAAANLLAAQALAGLQAGNPDAMSDRDPLALFAASAEADPHAPMTYWHAGRFAASIGDVETAWLLFDLARALPDAGATGAAQEADSMHERLQALAPDFFGPDGAR